ncbi:hypothetical protein D9611_008516 [Ephemerocybe angulata]|uniref:F-box domain-containing protein n=1 Tax=Ephemerocybe angulata TaxID=980116 RepID=A0A8H5AYU7_9AGAR|nr:hypothetical protein D9611_008516 [Tulosesus angulatus]
MNRCLQIPEILQLICNQLPYNRSSERQTLLAVALSCRALLEPGLDRLWYRIQFFKPILTILPSDLWKIEKKVGQKKETKFTVLGLRRAITSADLHRYLSYYAPRIREVDIGVLKHRDEMGTWGSITFRLQGCLANEPGDTAGTINGGRGSGVSLLLALSWAKSDLSSFHLCLPHPYPCDIYGKCPAHPVGGQITPDCGKRMLRTTRAASITRCLKSFTWENLEVLRVTMLSVDTISHISTLPRLTYLDLWDQKRLPIRYVYEWPKDVEEPPAHFTAMSATAFPSLRSLKITGDIHAVEAFVQQLPPNNRLHTFKCALNLDPGDLASLLITIRLHCHVDHLRKIVIKPESSVTRHDLGIDIGCILDFTNLETLAINLRKTTVNLGEHDIVNISKSFPQLRKLKIDTDVHDSRIPLIDHEDLLNLIYRCAHLKKLGLRFDATRITGEEKAPKEYTKPTVLEKLWVGDSPIYWPKGIAKVFEAHCPNLRGQNITLRGWCAISGENNV